MCELAKVLVSSCVYVCVQICVFMYVSMCVCIGVVCVCMYAYIYIYIHTYILCKYVYAGWLVQLMISRAWRRCV
jgi:hypothetical protein